MNVKIFTNENTVESDAIKKNMYMAFIYIKVKTNAFYPGCKNNEYKLKIIITIIARIINF